MPVTRPRFALSGERAEIFLEALARTRRTLPVGGRITSEQLPALLPLLECGGAAGVLERRQRGQTDAGTVQRQLRQAHLRQSLEFTLHEASLRKLWPRLESHGVEPILVKGLSVARLYPEKGMRRCGDLDLCVPPGQLQAALAALENFDTGSCQIDLHEGVADLEDRTWEEIFHRSRRVEVGNVRVRLLGWEDQLRHLAMHMFRHGAWRPMWLCDVAVTLESLPAGIDWNYCLNGHNVRDEWLLCALGLARALLGMPLPAALAERCPNPPRWVVACVEDQWRMGATGDSHSRDFSGIKSYLRRPFQVPHALRRRWPNPIEAVFKLGGAPQIRLPKYLYQSIFFALRARRFLTRSAPLPVAASPLVSVHVPTRL